MKPFRRLSPTSQPDVDEATGRASFIFNDESVGRDKHVVHNSGIRDKNFRANPVILFAHDDKAPPVGRAVDVQIGGAGEASTVTIEFTPRSLNPFGAMIGDLVKARYLNCVSESWLPLKAKLRAGGEGYDFLECDLLEISIVPVPALPSAVATARAAGIDTRPMAEWCERSLDRAGALGIDRSEILMLRRAASGRSVAYSLPVDGGRARRAAIARELLEKTQRQDIALRLGARGSSQLHPASRETLVRVQGHHAKVEKGHGELARRHDSMARDVEALPGIHRKLKRALSAAGVSKDYGIADAMGDLDRCSNNLSTSHDGATSAVSDATDALGLAKSGVADVIDGVPEM